MPNWLLPENIADVLPSEARKIEELRRLMLDNFRLYGYELVMPPLLEYLESLMTGAGKDTDLRTFKLVDQLSGRMLGLRADMTTQVARIDAHLLNRSSVTRLCYAGSVLHTRPSGLHATREPLQIGAEIYGHAGLEADAEIQELALASLALAGFDAVRLDLSHVGLLRAIIAPDEQAVRDEAALYSLLRAKDAPGLRALTAAYDAVTRDALLALPNLYGDIVSDLCAGLVGGLGVAPGANIGTAVAVFEPVHGSAPKYAGLDRANPTAMILSGALMLRHLGYPDAAAGVERAVQEVIAEGRSTTYDLGGTTGTAGFADAVVARLGTVVAG